MTEMDKLDAMLTERGIEHTYGRRFPEMDELGSKEPYLFKDQDWGTQIVVYDGEMRSWDAICGYGSYGYEQGLIEVMGSVTDKDVEGFLTADEVIKRLKIS